MANVSISIDVPDLKQAVDFYTGALGCQLRPKQPKFNAVVTAGPVELHLLPNEAGSCPHESAEKGRSYERHWTPVHLDFLVDDVPGTVEKVVGSGGTHEGGEKADWGEIAYCADPFGNGFCIIRE